MPRIEKKFLVSNLFNFYEYLNKNSYNNSYNDRNILSIYYDTIKLNSFHDADEGVRPRRKIRLRKYYYPGTNLIKKNLKNYFNEYFTLEKKITSHFSNYKTKKQVFFNPSYLILNDKQYKIVKPVSLVTYDRKYFLSKSDRITLDYNIKFYTIDQRNHIKFNKLENKYIIEFKCPENNFFNQWSKLNFFSTRYSKYMLSIKS